MSERTELEKTIRRIERILRDDIHWLLRTKDKRLASSTRRWNPDLGAIFDYTTKQFWPGPGIVSCGTCAIGAHVIRATAKRNTAKARFLDVDDLVFAARSLKLDEDHTRTIYLAVAEKKTCRKVKPSAFEALGYRLRDYADSLVLRDYVD